VTPLQARTFAVWTLTSAIVRGYAAYHIDEKMYISLHLAFLFMSGLYMCSIYDMALFTYLIAFGHFISELLIFRTAKINAGVMSPVVVSCEFIYQRFNHTIHSCAFSHVINLDAEAV
jgi:hypothetical protein